MADFSTITADELKGKKSSGDEFLLVDTLGDESYESAHIPGAKNIGAHSDDFLSRIEEQASRADEIVLYCASFDCPLSGQASEQLAEAGFENVIDYEGGLKDWVNHGGELVGSEAEEKQAAFAGTGE